MSTYRIVTLTYPKTYRQDHLTELVETANELHPTGWSTKESKALLTNGLRTRARLATSGGDARHVWTVGIRTALLITASLAAAFSLVFWLELGGVRRWMTEPSPTGLIVFCELAAVAALLLTTRWPAAVAVSTAAGVSTVASIQATHFERPWQIALPASALVAASLAWWMALRGDPGQHRRARPINWIAAVGLIGLVLATGNPIGYIVATQAQLVLLPVLALVLTPVDPRLAAVTACSWALVAPTVFAATWEANNGDPFAPWVARLVIPALLAGAFFVTHASTRRLTRT